MQKVLLFIFLLISVSLKGQVGNIEGIVTNGADNKPSPLITIILRQNNTDLVGTISDTLGKFSIQNISPGKYNLKLTFVGYEQYTFSNIEVFADSTLSLDIKYPCPHGSAKAKKICPYGHKDNIIPIVYGFPSEKTFEKAEKGEIELGGCLVSDCDPKWYCKEHNIRF